MGTDLRSKNLIANTIKRTEQAKITRAKNKEMKLNTTDSTVIA